MERTVQAPDGRTLAVEDAGAPDGRPILAHNGTPNSKMLFGPLVEDAVSQNIRLISYDRPGYGGSSPQPGRTVADCAADVRAICAALGIERLATWGISGGGPHVLACAALLPDLVAAAASLASPAPFGAVGLDWFDGMGELNVEDIKLSKEDPEAARAKADADRLEFLAATPEDMLTALSSVLTPTDAAALTGELADFLTRSAQAGLAPGSQGWWDDGEATNSSDWGFDLRSISIPVLLMHGRNDRFVPFAHGEWLAGQIPGVQARLSDDDGHLTLLRDRIGEVHAWLLGHLES